MRIRNSSFVTRWLLLGLAVPLALVSSFGVGASGNAEGQLLVVKRAFFLAETGCHRVTIELSQVTPNYSTKASGRGFSCGSKAVSDVTLHLGSGGATEFRQIGNWIYIQSYNSSKQHKSGSWTKLSVAGLGAVLDWPPMGLGDPAYLFASSNLYSQIANRLRSVVIENRAGGVASDGSKVFSLIVDSFRVASTRVSERPRLIARISNGGKLMSVYLYWPSVNSTSTETGGTSLSTKSRIVVRVTVGNFVQSPSLPHAPPH
jgi:hypothetical protein